MTAPAPGTYGAGAFGAGPYGGRGGAPGTYSQATEDAYARLPDFYREADLDGVLKRWISAMFDQVGQMRSIRERIALEPRRAGLPRPSGEHLVRVAAGLPVTGSWTAVPTAGGGVGLRTNGPDEAHGTWHVRVDGGLYRLLLDYEAGPDRGFLRLEVDGLHERTIDTYSPQVTTASGVEVVATVQMPRGFHTIRAHWTGVKRAESAGTFVVVGGFALVNVLGQNLDTSDLVDPSSADIDWLPWLAQLVGLRLQAELSATQRRDALRQAARFQSGSRQALVDAVRTVLTGNRSVTVYPHTAVAAGAPTAAGPWDLTVVTAIAETPGGAQSVFAAVRRMGAKPAGIRLFHAYRTVTWADFHAAFPTWAALHARPTWQAVADVPPATVTAAALTAPARMTPGGSVQPTTIGAAPLTARATLTATATVTAPAV